MAFVLGWIGGWSLVGGFGVFMPRAPAIGRGIMYECGVHGIGEADYLFGFPVITRMSYVCLCLVYFGCSAAFCPVNFTM
jgi:hypothetical protein